MYFLKLYVNLSI